ncbi:MAG: hypothetical protein KatS3mg131_2307 [Candidatus Tectimicrobiota bacterium]|nr:MAG: hypothetical protein KatS3mg131_2307 [Candidatus Tectomicrobia bacterium]
MRGYLLHRGATVLDLALDPQRDAVPAARALLARLRQAGYATAALVKVAPAEPVARAPAGPGVRAHRGVLAHAPAAGRRGLMTPAQRVGRTANLVIFLGILYSALNLAALLGSAALARRGYGLPGLGVALLLLVLGYGIRFGKPACLYAAGGLFATLAGVFGLLGLLRASVSLLLRAGFSLWALSAVARALPAMRALVASGERPVQTSRYGEFFLRRWRSR